MDEHYTHVIFDMDGLLIDTERLYTEVMERIAHKYGSEFTWAMKIKMMGMPGLKSAQIAVDEMKLPITAEEFLLQAKMCKDELFPTCNLMPGVERLVSHLKKNNVPIAVASGSFTEDFKTKTRRHQKFFEQFSHIVLGDDPEIKHGKPHPDVFLITAKRFENSPDPSKVLVFEDSPNGITAAVSAGMGSVLVPDPRLSSEHYNGATLVISSLEDFSPDVFGLPAYM